MNKRNVFICGVALFLSLVLLSGCGSGKMESSEESVLSLVEEAESFVSSENSLEQSESEQEEGSAVSKTEESSSVEELLEQMTLREKVGQLFIIRPDGLDLTLTPAQVNESSSVEVTRLTDEMKKVLQEYPVGGIALFGKNFESPEQTETFIKELQRESDIPLWIAVDEEGGVVARLANHDAFDLPRYESAAAVGEKGNPDDALDMGNTIGGYLARYGFNMNFAPVADVNTNPDNPVIGNRAFSADGKTAANMAVAMADGLKRQGIVPVFKHFPGHGDTAEDSHSGIAVSYKSKEEMEQCEWLPYENLTVNDCVMVGHIATPELTGTLIPATMSEEIVQEVLRQQLGFEGVVITDSLSMGAITDQYDSAQAAVGVVDAGCDILLTPWEFTKAFDGLLSAVEQGTITQQRLNESVIRILELKKAYGLLD